MVHLHIQSDTLFWGGRVLVSTLPTQKSMTGQKCHLCQRRRVTKRLINQIVPHVQHVVARHSRRCAGVHSELIALSGSQFRGRRSAAAENIDTRV